LRAVDFLRPVDFFWAVLFLRLVDFLLPLRAELLPRAFDAAPPEPPRPSCEALEDRLNRRCAVFLPASTAADFNPLATAYSAVPPALISAIFVVLDSVDAIS
jgi:hypothetical protein